MSDQSAARICNQALSLCGESAQITALTDESLSARLCSQFLDDTRRDILACGHAWSFATTTAALVRNATTPLKPWVYAWAPPDKMVKPLHLADERLQRLPEQAYPFLVAPTSDAQALEIYTQVDPATLVYVRDVDNYGIWTSKARNALAAALAVKLIGPLKGDLQTRSYIAQVASEALGEAMIDDYQRRADGPNIPSRYEAARG